MPAELKKPVTVTQSVTVTGEAVVTEAEAKIFLEANGWEVTKGGTEPPPDDEFEWVFRCKENQNFTLSEPSKVRYGSVRDKDGNVVNAWTERNLPAGTHRADNATFTDPIRGVLKDLEVWTKKSSGGGGGGDPDPDPDPIEDPQTFILARDPNNVKGAHRGINENIGTSAQNPKSFASKGTEVYRALFDISQFRTTLISERFLEHLGQYLSQCINAGVTVNFSMFYWWGSSADALRAWQNREPTEADLPLMLRHTEQLEPIFEKYAPAINYLAAFLVGKWAEWNKSYARLGIEDNTEEARRGRKQFVDLVMQALPKELMFAFRYMGHYRERFGSKILGWDEAYGDSDQARTGQFYDFYPADFSEGEWDDVGNITQYTIFGGEGAPSSYDEGRARQALREFAATHWHHMQPMFQDAFRRFGIYDELIRRMGYRYVIKGGALPRTVRGSDKLRVDLIVENEGFANLHKKKDIDIVLRNRSSGTVIRVRAVEGLETDARRILPRSGTTKTLKLSAQLQNVPAGSYDVLLHIKDIYAITSNRPEYSIRFANLNTWESTTGFTKLNTFITVN